MNKQEFELNLSIKDISMNSLYVEENKNKNDYTRENFIELVSFDDSNKTFELKYTDKLVHNVIIRLELTAIMKADNEDLNEEILNEIIKSDNVDDLAMPILNEATHIVSFITSKTNFMPMIVPPTFRKFNSKTDEDEDD